MMKKYYYKFSENPHIVFLLAIPLLFILGFIFTDRTVDLQLHDTYFVIVPYSISVFAGIYFGLVSLMYYLMRNRKLNRLLTSLHILLSLSILLWFFVAMDDEMKSATDYQEAIRITGIAVYGTIIFIGGQFLFLVNLVWSFFRK